MGNCKKNYITQLQRPLSLNTGRKENEMMTLKATIQDMQFKGRWSWVDGEGGGSSQEFKTFIEAWDDMPKGEGFSVVLSHEEGSPIFEFSE